MEFGAQLLHCACVFSVFVVEIICVTSPTAITFDNNSYNGVLVAIHPDIPQDYQLITSIKEMFIEASAYLNTATGHRAHFGNVTILIPDTWTSNSSWNTASSELFSNAIVVIKGHTVQHTESSPQPNTVTATGAYTQSYGRCGQSGVRIVLFTDIFNGSKMAYGPTGRLLVHEWAHFRWGVFDEYAEDGGPQFYFSPTTRKLEAVRCNLNMAGAVIRLDPVAGQTEQCDMVDPLTGSFDKDCVFSPYVTGHINENITASIMDRQSVPSIIHFCNDDTSEVSRVHNFESPSRHNRLCGSRSTWSVISESTDFQGRSRPPQEVLDTTPTFRVVQTAMARRIVLAIDTSESMEAHNKLTRAVHAATYFIEDALDDGVSLGVVTFSTVAKVASQIIELTDEASRKDVTQRLPTRADGATSIGSALLTSIQLLKSHDQRASDVFIVLLTDGYETTKPTIDDITQTIRDEGAVVSVIAFDDDDQRSLEKLAAQTGGRFYFDTREDMSTSAVGAMLDVYKFFDSGRGHLPVQIVSHADYLPRYETLHGSFIMDSSLGKNTRAIVTYTTDTPPNITVTSPTGRRFCYLYPEYFNDPSLKRVKITIPELAEIGHWTYFIINNDQSGMYLMVSIVVLSSGRDPTSHTLKFSGDIFVENTTWPIKSVIVAEVTLGDTPSRDLKVLARVNRPMASPETLELFDNGAGADAVKGDGIYSRFFTRFSTSGHYSVNIAMMNARGDVIVSSGMHSEPSQIASGYASSVHIEHPKLSPKNASTNSMPVLDEYPPMRITDLRVLHTSAGNGTVVLAWTAPGDDMDYDKAASYSIVMSSSADAIVNNKDLPDLDPSCVIKGNLNSPKPFGFREQVTLRLDMFKGTNASMVFAIFAVDDSGNKAEISNFVTVGFEYVPDLSMLEYLHESNDDGVVGAKTPTKRQIVVIACMAGTSAVFLIMTTISTTIIQVVSYMNKRKALHERFHSDIKIEAV